MWSRTPSTSQPPPAGPGFLTSHLRRASANQTRDTSIQQQTTQQTTSPPTTSASLPRPSHKPSLSTPSVMTVGSSSKARAQGELGVSLGVPESEEDDAWADGSDDEAAVTRLRHQTSNIGLGLPSTASRGSSGTEPVPVGASVSQSPPSGGGGGGGGWSLFSIIPGASKSTTQNAQLSTLADKPPPLPTPVEAAAPAPVELAGSVCGVDEDDSPDEPTEGEAHGKGKERRGSSYQMELWKKQVKSNIQQLVAGNKHAVPPTPLAWTGTLTESCHARRPDITPSHSRRSNATRASAYNRQHATGHAHLTHSVDRPAFSIPEQAHTRSVRRRRRRRPRGGLRPARRARARERGAGSGRVPQGGRPGGAGGEREGAAEEEEICGMLGR